MEHVLLFSLLADRAGIALWIRASFAVPQISLTASTNTLSVLTSYQRNGVSIDSSIWCAVFHNL